MLEKLIALLLRSFKSIVFCALTVIPVKEVNGVLSVIVTFLPEITSEVLT